MVVVVFVHVKGGRERSDLIASDDVMASVLQLCHNNEVSTLRTSQKSQWHCVIGCKELLGFAFTRREELHVISGYDLSNCLT